MSSDNATDDLIREATKGALDWASEKGKSLIKNLAEKIRNKDLVFIGDRDTIERAKQQRHKSEFTFFKQIITNTDSRNLFQMGLTLRSLQRDNKEAEMKNLKTKIKNKFDHNGLHFAYFVQNGLFSKYLGIVGINEYETIEQLRACPSSI